MKLFETRRVFWRDAQSHQSLHRPSSSNICVEIRGRASASRRPKGPGFESRDKRVLPFGIFPHRRREYWLGHQEAIIERDLYKLRACFAIAVLNALKIN